VSNPVTARENPQRLAGFLLLGLILVCPKLAQAASQKHAKKKIGRNLAMGYQARLLIPDCMSCLILL